MTKPHVLELADALEDAGMPARLAEAAARELRRLHIENSNLKAWIRGEGIRSNICTWHELKERCQHCECHRKEYK